MIAIDLSNRVDVDPNAIKKINFAGDLDREAKTFSIIKKVKKAIVEFS